MPTDTAPALLSSAISRGSLDGKISWGDLRAVMVVAVYGSLNKAGMALEEGQLAIGRRIMRLEAEMGLSLLRRGVNAVTITAAGRRRRNPARLSN